MKPTKSIVIGTAGHIDHGKTALVRALTGVDTDRLPEEKRRGITIDLGFASLDTNAPDGSPLRISFVDVPGHALFIRNMLAGAGCVPAVMLVIAADEGVMPQTREHLAICRLLGIADGLTVISKADLVDETQLIEVRRQIKEFLKGTFLGGDAHPIIAASAHKQAGLTEVRTELARIAMREREDDHLRPMRLPIDRVFVKKGFGTVVTGTLLSGEIRVGQNLLLEPGARSVRVRGLQTHGAAEDIAQAGSRTAVNLSGVDAADVSRGQTLVFADELAAASTFDAEITLIDGAPPLKHRARVHLHAFTSEVMADVFLYGSGHMTARTTRLARLRCSHPIVVVAGDRFVLRQPLPAGTIGGGRVLDANLPLKVRRAQTESWLQRVAHAGQAEQLKLRVERLGSQGIPFSVLARQMGLKIQVLRNIAAALVDSGELMIISGEILISPSAYLGAVEAMTGRVNSAGVQGLKRSILQSQSGLGDEVFASALQRLVTEGKAQVSGESIAIAGAAPSISGKEAETLSAVTAAYLKAGLSPAGTRDVASQLGIAEPEMRRLITFLLRDKKLMRMGSDDTFVHAEAVRQLAAKLAAMRGKTIDVAAFKTLTGLTRKYAIPLLELLDRERITRKQADTRIIL